MAVAVLMPKLGLTMEAGTVTKWLKQEGEAVGPAEPLAEIETDKIVTQVESPQAGTLLKVVVPEGAEVKVLAILAVVGEPGEDISAILGAQPEAPPSGA